MSRATLAPVKEKRKRTPPKTRGRKRPQTQEEIARKVANTITAKICEVVDPANLEELQEFLKKFAQWTSERRRKQHRTTHSKTA
jgi:hypothetical protein